MLFRSGLYVGLTRGRTDNITLAIAANDHAAQARVADAMLRSAEEGTLIDSARAARRDLHRGARTWASDPMQLAVERSGGAGRVVS